MSNTYSKQQLSDGTVELTAIVSKDRSTVLTISGKDFLGRDTIVSVTLTMQQSDELVQRLLMRRAVSATD